MTMTTVKQLLTKRLEAAIKAIEERRDANESTLEDLRQELYELTELPNREELVGKCFKDSYGPDDETKTWAYRRVVSVPKDSRDAINIATIRLSDDGSSVSVDLCEPYPANMLKDSATMSGVSSASRAEWKNAVRRARAVLKKLR